MVVIAENSASKALARLPYKVYYGTIAHTPTLGELEVFPNCAVLVDCDGVIKAIDRNCDDIVRFYKEHLEPDQKVDLVDITSNPYQFFFPGFVDTHIHAPQFPNAGIFGNSTLLDWLETYTFPLEASLSDLDKARRIYTKVVHRTLHNGTTTASYFATIDPEATKLLADICFAQGQRAFIGRVCMDDNSPDFYSETHAEVKSRTVDVCSHIGKLKEQERSVNGVNLVSATLTPRFAPSCTKETLQWLGQFRKEHHLHVQSHVSENKSEIELVHKLFPESSSYTGVYSDYGLLSCKTVLAHGVHLSKSEIALLAASKTGIAHCPISNSSLTSGETNVRKLLDNNVKVSLGTDMSGGFSPSILTTARHAHLVSRHLAMKTENQNCHAGKLSVNEVLYLGTKGGAQCLAVDKMVGDFQVGKKWECQLIDLNSQESQIDVFDWQVPEYLLNRNQLLNRDGTFMESDKQKFDDMIAKWVFVGDDRNTVQVYVNGRLVVSKC